MGKRNSRLVAYIIVPLIFTLIAGAILFVGTLRPTEGIVRAYNQIIGEGDPQFGEPDVQHEVNADMPSYGAFYANIYSERFDYSGKIYYGISERMLKKGICQVDNTALIGSVGTGVLYADNEGPFWVLEDMEQGDVLRIDTGYGSFEYEVTKAKVGYEAEVAEVNDGNANLILYTGYPFKSNHKSDTYAKELEEIAAKQEGTHKIVWAKKVGGPIVKEQEAQ